MKSFWSNYPNICNDKNKFDHYSSQPIFRQIRPRIIDVLNEFYNLESAYNQCFKRAMDGITGLLKHSFAKYNGSFELATLVFSESLGLTALPSKFSVVTKRREGSTTETELHFESS